MFSILHWTFKKALLGLPWWSTGQETAFLGLPSTSFGAVHPPHRDQSPVQRVLCPGTPRTAQKGSCPLPWHSRHGSWEPGAKPFLDLLLSLGFIRNRMAPLQQSTEHQTSTKGFKEKRIHSPMKKSQVPSLVWELKPHMPGATKSGHTLKISFHCFQLSLLLLISQSASPSLFCR